MNRFFLIILSFSLFLFVEGCGTPHATVQQQKNEEQKQKTVKTKNREVSLQHFIAGSTYDAKNDYPRAALEYQEALQYDDDPAIFYALSRDYIQLNKLDLAEQNARMAVSGEPNSRDYRENLAQIFASQFNLDSAIQSYKEIVQLDSEYIAGWFNYAHTTQFKSPAAAKQIYRQILDRFGSNWDVWEQLATIAVKQKNFDEAASAYKEMLVLDPSNSELQQTLATLYEASGNDSLALELYTTLAADSENIDARVSTSRLLLMQHKYGAVDSMFNVLLFDKKDSVAYEMKLRIGESYIEALQKDSTVVDYVRSYFTKLKDEKPDDWRSYWFLAAMYASEDKFEEAKFNYKKVTELDSSNVDGWVNLASLFSERQKFAEMAEVLEDARKIIPNDFRVNFFLGIAYYRNGEYDKAIDPLERAVLIRPNEMNALSTLALIYDALKRWKDSDRIYEEALKVEPNNHLLMNNYSYSLTVRGEQLPRALEMSKKALEQQPKNSSYLDTMGWIYFRLGNYEDAKKYIMDAIAAGGASAEVNEHLGDVYYKLNDTQKAMDYWKKSLELDGRRESAKERVRKGGL